MQINSAFQFQTLNNFDMFMYVMGFIKISKNSRQTFM